MKWQTGHSGKFYRGEGHFFRSGDLVGAQAMIWRSSSAALQPRRPASATSRRSIHAKQRRDYPPHLSSPLRARCSAKAG
jgi:hypothetical protein